MTEDKRQIDFAERLRRIEERQSAASRQAPSKRQRPASGSGHDQGSDENHKVRDAIIWVVFFAVLGAGGYFGWQAVPSDLKAMFADTPQDAATSSGEMVAVGLDEDPVPDETPTMSDQGPVLASPAVVHTGPDPLQLADLVLTPDLPTTDTAMGDIIPFARNAMCDLRDLSPNEQIVSVRIENALLPTSVQAFSNVALADRLLLNIEAVTQGDKPYDLDGRIKGELAGIDVFLTDTSAPIYLVLQNLGSGVLWNIHTAPDVTLAHVAMISSGFSALASPPDNATFEALLVSDFVPPHEFGADDQPRDCMIRPWRQPAPDWIGQIEADRGNALYENQMYTYSKGYEAYNRWYTATLGVDASTNAVTARDASHVLFGPIPPAPLTYRSMTGRDIHVMQTDHMFTGDTATRAAITDDLHTALLLAAVGGDLAALDPAPVERNTP